MSGEFSFARSRETEFVDLWNLLGTKQAVNPAEKYIKDYLEIIKSPNGGSRAEIDLCHLKRFLAKRGYHLKDKNFESLIEDGDIIEAYDLTGTQLFRTYEFFAICSYSLYELVTENWPELYERPQLTIQIMMSEWRKILESGQPGPHRLNVPKHILKELRGDRNHIECELKYGWIMYDENNTPVGVLDTIRGKVVPNPDRKVVLFRNH